MAFLKAICLFLLILPLVRGGESNLVVNGGFEEPLGNDNWYCSGTKCVADRTESSFNGRYAAHVHSRIDKADSIQQDVYNIKPNTNYYVSGFIKMLNDDGQFFSLARVLVILRTPGGNKRVQIGAQPHLQPGHGWVEVGGDVKTTADTTHVTVQIFMAENNNLNYLLDNVKMEEIVHDPDWLAKADARIEQHRKGNLRINTNAPGDPDGITIWINQTAASFPFGCTALRTYITDTDELSAKYQDYFYEMFNWATPTNDFKWRSMEPVKGEIDFEKPDSVLEALTSRGITNIRGHCIAWDKEGYHTEWMAPLTDPGTINAEVLRRIHYLVGRYKGQLKHWDVNNEIITGQWYERRTLNPEFTQGMFMEVHKLDPEAKLFLNDHAVFSAGTSVNAYRRLAGQMISNGVPLGGMGMQGHFRDYDLDVIKHRLDRMAQPGIPLWLTEFEMKLHDVVDRAVGVDNVLHLMYSHPAIEGIIIWGFWDQTHNLAEDGASLVDGDDFVENLAGAALRNLLKTKWRTHISHQRSGDPYVSDNFRVHFGSYTVTILKDGEIVHSQEVQVEKDQDAEVTFSLF